MRCTIVTHPPARNYGGILQAYALSSAIKNAGHDVQILQGPFKKLPFLKKILYAVKKLFGHDRNKRFSNLQKFVHDNLPLTPLWHGERVPVGDCVVVGSDQVWRPSYSPFPGAFFCDFLPEGSAVKRIAYAASFGVDHWEFSPRQSEEYGKLLKKFSAVSVREESGAALCKQYWHLDAQQMPDPTLLHTADFYRKSCDPSKGTGDVLFTYFLDPDEDKRRLAEETATALGVTLFNFLPENKKAALLPVQAFLSGIDNARMVLTDSFHGMVFSMIFGTPFAVTGNVKRGMTRFVLAKNAGAAEALLEKPYSVDKCVELASSPEIFAQVDSFLQHERKRGRAFLAEYLGGNFQ